MANMLILAYDGDNAGRLVGRAILADDSNALSEASQRISHGHEIVKQWVTERGGQVISGGGDEGVFQVPPDALQDLEQLRKDYQFATQLTITVGVGNSLSEAGKSLMVGKFRGKDQVVQYDESVEADMKAAQEHMAAGTASQEENKIGGAYMDKQEPEDNAENDVAAIVGDDHSDCPYCQEMEGATAHADDCQYCEEYDAQNGEAGDESLDSCPYCQEMHTEEEHTHGDDCAHCKEYDAQQAGAPAGEQVPAEAAPDAEAALTPDLVPQGDPNESQEIPQGQEEVLPPQEVLSGLDQEGQSASQEVNPLDALTDQPDDGALMDDGMVDGVSRPAGYDDNTPGDMGLAEDEAPQESPDLGEVLQGGLDQHADSIQKEKVVQMVSQALDGFKSQKHILERAQEQAPELYSSTIAMLKAMIEMAKMLGFGQEENSEDPLAEQPGEEAPAEGEAAPGEENQWHDPFPTHPDNAAPEEGAGQDPKPLRQ